MKKEDKKKVANKALKLLQGACKNGITCYKIARDTGITEQTVYNYANGDTTPTLANANILITYFTGKNNYNAHKVSNNGNNNNINIAGTQINRDQEEIQSLKNRINELEELLAELRSDKQFLQKLLEKN